MQPKISLLLTVLLLSATLVCSPAQAKDLIFHMGNELIQVIDTDTDLISDIPIKGAARDSAFTADKKALYLTGSRRDIEKLDLTTMKITRDFLVEAEGWDRLVYGLAISQDGKTGYVNVFSRKTENGEAIIGTPEVLQINLDNGKILRRIKVPFGIVSLCLVENDSKLYALGQDIYTIDVSQKQMKMVDTIPMFDKGMNILALWHYTAENNGIWLSPYYTAEGMGLLSIDTKSGKITETMLKGEPPFAYNAIYSPDHTKAYAVMDDVAIIDLKTKTYDKVVPVPEGTCYGVMPTTDGKKIYAGAGGSTITVFDAKTMKPIKILQMKTDGMGLRRLTI